jgi:hypothetical protein
VWLAEISQMKVLNLHCDQGHAFEGWFGSEADFQSQLERTLVACPMCSSTQVRKGLSAPRLNLGAKPSPEANAARNHPVSPATSASGSLPVSQAAPSNDLEAAERMRAVHAAWLQMSRRILANTVDVGDAFAEEARRIHYGDVPERGIRGQATPEQALELLEEGISVLPLPLADVAKETLQ